MHLQDAHLHLGCQGLDLVWVPICITNSDSGCRGRSLMQRCRLHHCSWRTSFWFSFHSPRRSRRRHNHSFSPPPPWDTSSSHRIQVLPLQLLTGKMLPLNMQLLQQCIMMAKNPSRLNTRIGCSLIMDIMMMVMRMIMILPLGCVLLSPKINLKLLHPIGRRVPLKMSGRQLQQTWRISTPLIQRTLWWWCPQALTCLKLMWIVCILGHQALKTWFLFHHLVKRRKEADQRRRLEGRVITEEILLPNSKKSNLKLLLFHLHWRGWSGSL